VLIQQLQKPITESAEEEKINAKNRKKQKLNTFNQSNTFLYRESVVKGDIVFPKNVQNLHMSFAVMTHLAEGLCLNALLVLKVENSLICLVGT
jgi:hypothetical protein